MAQGTLTAEHLAKDAGFYLIRADEARLVRARGEVLEVGVDASKNAIATVSCRRKLALRGVRDEAQVRACVRRLGFSYENGRLSKASDRRVAPKTTPLRRSRRKKSA